MIDLRRMKFDISNLNEWRDIDPRTIVGISIFPNEVRVVALNRLFSLQRKITIMLEETAWMTGGIKIKSIERTSSSSKNFLIIETDGPMCPTVQIVAKKILDTMTEMDIQSAFFPGENVLKSISDNRLFYFGQKVDNLKIVGSSFDLVKIVGEHLIFYCRRQKLIKKMRLQDTVCDYWDAYAYGLCRVEDVVFFGRVKDNILPVSLREGRILMIDIFSGRVVLESYALEEPGVYIGEVEDGTNAAIIGEKLVLFKDSLIRT